MSTTNAVQEAKVWHAMRATYNRAMLAKELLESKGVRTFVPLRYEMRERPGRKKTRELVPVMRNLIFAYVEPSVIQEIKSHTGYLQYITNTRTKEKILVPEKQMEQFIAVCGTMNDHLLWLRPEEVDLKKGQRVRILGGEFEGYEGVFMKVRGARDRRVVIEIRGVVSVALATVHPSLIETIA